MNKVCIFLSIIIFLWACLVEPNLLTVRHYDLEVSNCDFHNLKIIVVSDLHVGRKFININKLNKISEKINEQNPDLVLMLGDLDGNSIVKSSIDV